MNSSANSAPPGAARFSRPVIIIGCNRSGTTLLYNNLSAHPETWSLYLESQDVFHRHFPVHDELGDRVSTPATPEVADQILETLYERSHNKEFFQQFPVLRHVPPKLFQRPLRAFYRRPPIRLVEKTPANAFRIPLLTSIFPDARYLYVVRRGEDVVSSLMEGWKRWSRTADKSWEYTGWHYLVPPGWRQLARRGLAEICALQWTESNRCAWTDLQTLAASQFLLLRHEEMIEAPQVTYRTILQFCELNSYPSFDRLLANLGSRLFTTGGSPPKKNKWQDLHPLEIDSIRHLIDPINRQFYGQ